MLVLLVNTFSRSSLLLFDDRSVFGFAGQLMLMLLWNGSLELQLETFDGGVGVFDGGVGVCDGGVECVDFIDRLGDLEMFFLYLVF